jgi:hypothetical protein
MFSAIFHIKVLYISIYPLFIASHPSLFVWADEQGWEKIVWLQLSLQVANYRVCSQETPTWEVSGFFGPVRGSDEWSRARVSEECCRENLTLN